MCADVVCLSDPKALCVDRNFHTIPNQSARQHMVHILMGRLCSPTFARSQFIRIYIFSLLKYVRSNKHQPSHRELLHPQQHIGSHFAKTENIPKLFTKPLFLTLSALLCHFRHRTLIRNGNEGHDKM